MQNFNDNGKKDFVWGGWRKPYQYILDEAKTPEVAPEVSDVQESLGMHINLYDCGRKHYKEIRSILKDANKYQGPSGLDPLIHDAMINLEHLAVALAEPHSTPSVMKAVEDYRNKVFMSIRQFIRGVQANTRPSYFSGQRQFPLALKIDKLLLKIQNCSQSFTTTKKARQSPTLLANPFKDLSVSEAVDGPWENSSIVGIKSQRVVGWKTELKTARGHGGAPHGHQVYFLYHDGKGNFTVYHGDSLGKVVPAASAKKPVGVFKSKEDAMAGAKKDAASLHEDVEMTESVSANREYRQKKIQANRRLIVKLGTAAQKVEDTAARRMITQTLSSADANNRRLGTPEFLKYGPAYWVNYEGIYVGRELEMVRSLLVHHGIVIPTSESVEVTEMHDEMSYIPVQGLIANIEKRLAEFETAVKNPTPKDTVRSMDIRATKLDRLIGTLRSLKAEGASSKAYDFGKRLHQANIRRAYGNPQGRAESVEEGDAMTEAKRQPEENFFKSYMAAVNAARAKAEKKGYEIDEDDWSSKVTHGFPGRPSEGKTTNFKIRLLKGGKPVKNMLVVSVYGMSASFELTSYIS